MINPATSLGFQGTKTLSIRKHLVPYKELFTKPLFETCASFLETCIGEKDHAFAAVSFRAKKSISGISYFFNHGIWDHRALQQQRLATIKTHHDLKPRSDDLVIVDESCAAKTGSTFEKLDWVHDGRDGQIKRGYHLLGLLIVNQERGIRYVLDLFPLTTKMDNFRSIWRSWMRLMQRNLSHIKAKIFVFDAGFRNQYLLKFLRGAGKHFVIRVLASMVLETPDGRVKLGMLRQKTKRHRVRMKGIGVVELWALSGVMHAWKKELPETIRVLMARRQGFRTPLILATSQKLETLSEMAACYGQYLARWSIELAFKELKYDLSLEAFRVRSLKAIARWIALVVLVHTLLTLILGAVKRRPMLFALLLDILKKARKLQDILLIGLKKLYEMTFTKIVAPHRSSLHAYAKY